MVLLEKLWDDVIAGSQPDQGKLRKLTTQPILIKDGGKNQRSMSPIMVANATTSSPTNVPKDSVWRSVFHPRSNFNTGMIGVEVFDKPQPNLPSAYDCLQMLNQAEANIMITGSTKRKLGASIAEVAAKNWFM